MIYGKHVRYPEIIFVSPVGLYDHIFLEIKKLVLKTYTDAIFIPFFILQEKRSTPILDRSNYFQILFGHEGGILRRQLEGDMYFSFNKLD